MRLHITFAFVVLFLITATLHAAEYVKKETWRDTILATQATVEQASQPVATVAVVPKNQKVTLGDWYVSKPEKTGKFEVALPVEKLATEKLPPADWKKQSGYAVEKQHDLRLPENSTIYLTRKINAAEPAKQKLYVAYDDGVTLWLNGKKIYEHNPGGAVAANQKTLEVDLKKGENVLLMKLYNWSGLAGFYFSLNKPLNAQPAIATPSNKMVAQLQADFPIETAWILKDLAGKSGTLFGANAKAAYVELISAQLAISENYRDVSADQKLLTELSASAPVSDSRWIDTYAALAQYNYGKRLNRHTMGAYPPDPWDIPRTPETVNRTAEEGQKLLEADWLFQAGGKVTPQTIEQEITWTKELAARLQKDHPKLDLTKQLAQLEKLAKVAKKDEQLYFAIRGVKREIMFANPLVDFSELLFVDNPFPVGRHGRVWTHESAHRNGHHSVPGGRLLVLDGLHPAGKLRQLAPEEPGSFFRPDLSFDGKKVVFCFLPHNDDGGYHLYEVDINGKSPAKQLTYGDYDDLDPIYLPSGKIMFCSTRGHTYVRCLPDSASFVLARCDGDGKNIFLTSFNSEPDYLPSVMNDGRVVYSRWEYTDKGLWRIQSLWSTNPDGTGVAALWGNQSVWPDHTTEPRAIPGSNRVMFTGLGHHNWFNAGCIGIIDPAKGSNFPEGLTKVTQELSWPESGNGPTDPVETENYHASGKFTAYKSPYPLSEKDFLVSALKNGGGYRAGKYGIYLMDTNGNKELIYEGAHQALYPFPVKARKRPPVLPDRAVFPKIGSGEKPQNGIMYSPNVFEGAPDAEKLRQTAKYLRIFQMDPKTYSTWIKTAQHDGPAVSITQAEGVKRILGTTPIEKDGSVNFSIPPGIAVHFQLLDKDFRALHTMRSFTGVMPGESRGCIGCHEQQTTAVKLESNIMPAAMKRAPDNLTQPPWGADVSIGYHRFVQPTLDKYCGKCHQKEGHDAYKRLNMTVRPSAIGWRWKSRDAKSPFDEPYATLVDSPRGRPWSREIKMNKNGLPLAISGVLVVEGFGQRDSRALGTLPPFTMMTYDSKLYDNATSGKHGKGVKIDELARRRLIAWIDAMGPFLGEEEVRQIPDPVFTGVDLIPVRPRCETAPKIERFNLDQRGKAQKISVEKD